MATNQRTAKKTTPAQRDNAKKTAPAARKPVAKKPTPRRPAAKKTTAPLPTRNKPFMTDIQGHATLAALLAGITTPHIRDWHDHRNGTATRPLNDGSHLHYELATRTLTWQAICPMGATHVYTLDRPSTATAARLHADRCTETHANLKVIPRLTRAEWTELGIDTSPSWARPDLPGEDPITETIPVPLARPARALADQLAHTNHGTADTQPIPVIDNEQPKEHPQP